MPETAEEQPQINILEEQLVPDQNAFQENFKFDKKLTLKVIKKKQAKKKELGKEKVSQAEPSSLLYIESSESNWDKKFLKSKPSKSKKCKGTKTNKI